MCASAKNTLCQMPCPYPPSPPTYRQFSRRTRPGLAKTCASAKDTLPLPYPPSLPAPHLYTVLTAIAQLINEPNAADPINNEAAEMYMSDNKKFLKTAEEWVKKHAEKRP